MLELLICTHDNMLARCVCNLFRDEGHSVTMADHAAQAIQLMLDKNFDALLIDSDVIGLNVAGALPVIRRVAPSTGVIVIGGAPLDYDVWTVSKTAGLEEAREIIRGICEGGVNHLKKERV